jgi:hypothetical protein
MGVDSQHALNAANVADAVFASMVSRREWDTSSNCRREDDEIVQAILETIDSGLKTAGLSFAEYLDRIRHTQETSIRKTDQRWRFSARELAVQRVDDAVAHLCALMQQAN